MSNVRPIHEIGAEIRDNWERPYFGALPYIDAMGALDKVTDTYGVDSARSIIAYFLANAGSWRGDTARRVKAELKGMIK